MAVSQSQPCEKVEKRYSARPPPPTPSQNATKTHQTFNYLQHLQAPPKPKQPSEPNKSHRNPRPRSCRYVYSLLAKVACPLPTEWSNRPMSPNSLSAPNLFFPLLSFLQSPKPAWRAPELSGLQEAKPSQQQEFLPPINRMSECVFLQHVGCTGQIRKSWLAGWRGNFQTLHGGGELFKDMQRNFHHSAQQSFDSLPALVRPWFLEIGMPLAVDPGGLRKSASLFLAVSAKCRSPSAASYHFSSPILQDSPVMMIPFS
ncbi:hypothetical protein QBC47DRAFT_212424 [Echria macrotheca]|uniref:Uncharacterized protein n=1 Tax=Echria macrotheca TaxID=438768 RepID=A0AAJ0BED4_9PEZI|nr:hypothetical protein QBC47DRAFT_212424 [Echria macrotheca]